MQARNDNEVKAMIIPDLKNVVDYVVQKIWNDNRELVREIVYEAYSPVVYTRTGDFKEAWDTDVSSGGSAVQGVFKYAPDLMSPHTSMLSGEDIREGLAEIIYQGMAGDFTGRYRYARDNPGFAGQAWSSGRNAWVRLKKELGKRKLKNYFVAGLRANGIKFIDRRGALSVREFDEK